MLLLSADFFSKLTFSKNYFCNSIWVSNNLDLDQDRHSVGPDLDPNCLQRLSAHIGLHARKPVFRGLQTAKAQTSLRILAVWSAPLLFAFWKVSYLNLLQAKFKFSS